MTPSPNAPAVQTSWLRRNLRWLLLLGFVVPLLCCGVLGGGITFGVMKSMHSSEVYKDSLARAVGNADVQEALGTPITAGFFVSGSIRTSNGEGEAELQIPLEGPRKEATLYVVAKQKPAGPWEFSRLEVDLRVKRIDLLDTPVSPDAVPAE